MKNSIGKRQQPQIDSSPQAFESAFFRRIGQTPEQWISAKVGAGSSLPDVAYQFDIMAAAIAQTNHCAMQPFSRYYHPMTQEGVRAMSKNSVTTYNKLVRDRIPEIIAESGKVCTVETLSDADYMAKLDEKLNEELAEYQDSKSLEELADLLEVMGAVVKAKGYTWEELTKVRKKKLEERGGFEKKILLKEVFENVSFQAESKPSSQTKKQPANAGKPWTEAEEDKLLDEFDSQMPLAEIAKEHGRTKGGIEARLIKLGRISKPETANK